MSCENDFKIEDGVLIGYTGWEKAVVIPDTVEIIGEFAFRENAYLESVVIPDSVKQIERFAFKGCHALRKLEIPTSVVSIGFYAVADCGKLSELSVAKGNERYISRGNCIIDRRENSLVLGCGSSIIPSDGSVTAIGEFAFASCVSLESIVIPRGVRQIRDYAFVDCYNLDSVIFSDTPNPEAPWLCPTDYIGCHAFEGCACLRSIEIPRAVSCIGERAFFGCEALKSVTASDRLCCIGKEAFGGCSGELTFNIPLGDFLEDYARKNRFGINPISE